MPAPVYPIHKNRNLGFDTDAYSDPLWASASIDEIMGSEITNYLIERWVEDHKRDIDGSLVDATEFLRGCFRDEVVFFRNARIKHGKPKILRNTVGMDIPCSGSQGFSFSPGISVHHAGSSLQITHPNGLFHVKWDPHSSQIVGRKYSVPTEIGGKYWDTHQFGSYSAKIITAAALPNIQKIHNEANEAIGRLIKSAPGMLDEYIRKHSGESKVATQLSQLIFSNGWHDQDPNVLFTVLDFCKDNTAGIRDFSTWVRTHKAQIKLLDKETVKQAIGLANIMTVSKE